MASHLDALTMRWFCRLLRQMPLKLSSILLGPTAMPRTRLGACMKRSQMRSSRPNHPLYWPLILKKAAFGRYVGIGCICSALT